MQAPGIVPRNPCVWIPTSSPNPCRCILWESGLALTFLLMVWKVALFFSRADSVTRGTWEVREVVAFTVINKRTEVNNKGPFACLYLPFPWPSLRFSHTDFCSMPLCFLLSQALCTCYSFFLEHDSHLSQP